MVISGLGLTTLGRTTRADGLHRGTVVTLNRPDWDPTTVLGRPMGRFVDNLSNSAKAKESRRSDFQQIRRSGTVLHPPATPVEPPKLLRVVQKTLLGHAQYHRVDISRQAKEKIQYINPSK